MSRSLFFRLLFWLAALTALVMALLPQPPDLPFHPTDKLQHAAAFVALAALAPFAFPRLPVIAIGLALAAFGAGIEFLQLIPALHRDAEFSDWTVDVVAVCAVLAIAGGLRWMSRRAT